MLKQFFICSVILYSTYSLISQDVDFSDFALTHTSINPGLTGGFEGRYRFLLPICYFIRSEFFNGSNKKGNLLSTALTYYHEASGVARIKQNLASINLAYYCRLSSKNSETLSFGVSLGCSNVSAQGTIISRFDTSYLVNTTPTTGEFSTFNMSLGLTNAHKISEDAHFRLAGSWLQVGRRTLE